MGDGKASWWEHLEGCWSDAGYPKLLTKGNTLASIVCKIPISKPVLVFIKCKSQSRETHVDSEDFVKEVPWNCQIHTQVTLCGTGVIYRITHCEPKESESQGSPLSEGLTKKLQLSLRDLFLPPVCSHRDDSLKEVSILHGSLVVQMVKNLHLQCGRPGFNPWLARSPGEGHGNPLQYSCLENLHGQRSLVGYGPWGCKEPEATEHSTAQLPLEMQADHSILIHHSILISLLEEARHN